LTGNRAGLRIVLSSHFSHRKLRSSLTESHVSSVCLPTPRWHLLKAQQFLAIQSADKHRMIYSFSNNTSYSTFYILFSSFQITLRPMWLANSKRQPFFIHHSHTHKKKKELTKKLTNLMGNLCSATEHSFQFFVQFFTRLNRTV